MLFAQVVPSHCAIVASHVATAAAFVPSDSVFARLDAPYDVDLHFEILVEVVGRAYHVAGPDVYFELGSRVLIVGGVENEEGWELEFQVVGQQLEQLEFEQSCFLQL